MSSHKSLFSKTLAKRAKLDGEEKQGDSTLGSAENTGASTGVRKPAFNPALLDSAFYTGPVSYGGAGISVTASPYNQYTTSKFYDKKKIDIKVIPSKTEATVGQIAKTICECLESYSSPISDAKRVPVNNRPPFSSHGRTFNNSSIFDTSRRYLLSDNLTPTRPHRSRELQIPSIAALSKIKKTNQCNNARAAIMASMSSSLPCEPKSYKLRSDEGTSAYKNKIKTKINTVRGTKGDEEEMAQPVHLHNISLNITSLPTFSESPFSLTTSTKYSAPDTPPASTTNVVAVENNFKFTSPLHVRGTETSKTSMKFNFSEPVDIFNPKQIEMLAKIESEKDSTIRSKDVSGDSRTSISSGLKFSKPETPSIFTNFKAGDSKSSQKTTDKPSTELWNGIDNKKKNVEKSPLLNGDIPYSDYGKRSHADSASESTLVDSDENANIKKIKSDPSAAKSSGLESFIKKQQQQWECSSCMTRNEQSKDKCVCCEASKPGVSSTKPSTTVSAKPNTLAPASSFSGLGSFMKKQQEQWECSSCMTRNEQSKEKCVCCETPKPGASTNSAATSGFANFMKKQQQQWECSSCMSRNDQNRNKCACCEAPKPGSEPSAPAAASFNFGNPQNTFKFGIDKAADSSKTMVSESKTAEVKSLETVAPVTGFTFGNQASVENKTGNKSISSFKFGVPSTDSKTAETVAPATGYTFGNQASVENKTGNGSVGGFKFGVPTTETKTAESATPAPMFAFSDKKETTNTVPVGGFTFGIKSSDASLPGSSVTDAKTGGFSFGSVQKDNDVKKETIISNTVTETDEAKDAKSPLTTKVDIANTTSSAAVPSNPKPTFTFSTQSKPEFTNKPLQFGSPASKPSITGTDSFTPSKPFTFGQNASETKPNTDSPSKPSFQLPSNTGNLFPSANSTQSQGADAKIPSVLTGQFQPSTPAEKPKDQPPPVYFTFGSAASSSSSSAATFKSPASNVPAFSFGSANTSKPEGSTLFNAPAATSAPVTLFGAKPSTEQSLTAPPNPLFKAPTTATPTFGSPSATNIFKPSTDSASPSSNVFGSSALNQPGAKPPPALFGTSPLTSKPSAPTAQGTTSPFSSSSVPSFGAGNIFGNTASSNTISPMPGNMFGTSLNKPAENTSGMFSAQPSPAPTNIFASSLPSAATSQQSTNPMFGSSPSVPTPVFGASIPFGEASQNQPPQNVQFKFNSPSSSQPPAMGFGQAPAAGSSVPIFSFGSGSAAPPTNSQFNFSMGAPSSAFPTPGQPAARRFKKAVRRNNVR